MKQYILQNYLKLIIIFLLIALLTILLFTRTNKTELSFQNIKNYANELRSKSLYLQAIEAYKEYLKNAQMSKKIRANIHYFIGEIYKDNLKDFDKALSHYIKIKYIDPSTSLMQTINQNIVNCLENSGRGREAQLALKEATMLNNKNQTSDEKQIIAKIDSDIITLKDFNTWFDQFPMQIRKEYSSPLKKKEMLHQFIAQELFYRKAMRKGYQNDPDIIKKSYEIKKSLMTQKLMQEELLGKINITMKDMELYYRANRQKYKKPLQEISNIVQQDLMQEKVQEKSQELLSQMIKANSVQIFDGNLR